MITCDNCGAQYDDDADKCPYCGSDNFGKAVQEHEDTINRLNREKEFYTNMPNRAANTGKSILTRVLIIIAVITLIAGIGGLLSGVIERKLEYRTLTRNTQKLETLYQSGDYEGIYDYVKKKNILYDWDYKKYYDIAQLEIYKQEYINLEYASEENMKWLLENDTWSSLYNVEYIVDMLALCQKMENNDIRNTSTDIIAYYRDIAYTYLEEYYAVNSEEAGQVIDDCGGFEDDNYDQTDMIAISMKKYVWNKLKEKEA